MLCNAPASDALSGSERFLLASKNGQTNECRWRLPSPDIFSCRAKECTVSALVRKKGQSPSGSLPLAAPPCGARVTSASLWDWRKEFTLRVARSLQSLGWSDTARSASKQPSAMDKRSLLLSRPSVRL